MICLLRNFWWKGIFVTFFTLAIPASYFYLNYHRISPKLQAEYSRDDLNQDLRTVFEEYKKSIPEMMAKQKTPGLSIAVVDCDGILWTAGFGYTDYDLETPITPDTMFLINSMTKAMTATAVMCAVQDGLVELDVPITNYLPDFTVNSRYEDDPQDKITLRRLLNHTSGLAHEAPIGNNRDICSSFETHIKSISDTWLRYRVGEKFSYSNNGIDLAAYILQVKSGRMFAEYLKQKLFDPLEMPNTSTDYEVIKKYPNRAVGHYPYVKEVLLENPFIGAGGVYSNAKELARFVQFHLNLGRADGKKILEENLIRTMYGPTLATNVFYGLGVGIGKNITVSLKHGGGGFGFRSYMAWAPEYGIGCLVLTNSEYPGNDPENLVTDVLQKLVIGKKLIEKRRDFDIFPAKAIDAADNKDVVRLRPTPDKFTRYKPEWKKFVGTYRYLMNGWKLETYAKIGVALGFDNSGAGNLCAKVYEKGGFLEIDGQRLDEHLPGLFFADDGRCLDFRGPKPTWDNYSFEK